MSKTSNDTDNFHPKSSSAPCARSGSNEPWGAPLGSNLVVRQPHHPSSCSCSSAFCGVRARRQWTPQCRCPGWNAELSLWLDIANIKGELIYFPPFIPPPEFQYHWSTIHIWHVYVIHFFHRYYFNTDESSICIPLPVVESRNPTLPLFLSHMKWDCGQPCLEEPSFPGTRRNSSNSTILTYICVAPTVRWAHFLSFWSLTIPRISGIPFLQVVKLRLKGGNNLHKFHSYEEAKSEYKTPQHLIVSITLNGSINKKDTNMY